MNIDTLNYYIPTTGNRQRPGLRGLALNRSNPFSRGIVGLYCFPERNSGTIRDVSGFNNNGVTANLTAASFMGGDYGQSCDFNGSSSGININTPAGGSNVPEWRQVEITVFAIFYLRLSQTARIFANCFSSTGSASGWGLGIDDTTANAVKWFTAGVGSSGTQTSGPVTLQKWHTAMGIHEFRGTGVANSRKSLYVNGEKHREASALTSISYNADASCSIGYLRFLNSQFLNGQLAMVAIWNRAFTDGEARAFHLDPYQIFERESDYEFFPDNIAAPDASVINSYDQEFLNNIRRPPYVVAY